MTFAYLINSYICRSNPYMDLIFSFPFPTGVILFLDFAQGCQSHRRLEPVFVNVSGAQKSIPPGWESIPELLKKIRALGSFIFHSSYRPTLFSVVHKKLTFLRTAYRTCDTIVILDFCPRYGHLSQEIFRACRLVVDTGMHALGWTQEQAVQYMVTHTASTLQSIQGEVSHMEPGAGGPVHGHPHRLHPTEHPGRGESHGPSTWSPTPPPPYRASRER
jgi:hypothetical protein